MRDILLYVGAGTLYLLVGAVFSGLIERFGIRKFGHIENTSWRGGWIVFWPFFVLAGFLGSFYWISKRIGTPPENQANHIHGLMAHQVIYDEVADEPEDVPDGADEIVQWKWE